MEKMINKDLENAWAVQGIRQEKCAKLEEENKKLTKCNLNLQEWLDNKEKVNKSLREENKKLKSDLSECECSMHFENDEVGYRKRECKKLKEELSKYKKQPPRFSDFGGYDLDNNK